LPHLSGTSWASSISLIDRYDGKHVVAANMLWRQNTMLDLGRFQGKRIIRTGDDIDRHIHAENISRGR